jgi:serine/threonine protein kinase
VPILPGKRLGPYETLSAVGAGGMGAVYRARDTRLDRIVAIKILPDHQTSNPHCVQACVPLPPATRFRRSQMTADPVLELEARDALEFAFVVGDEGEPCGFGVSSNVKDSAGSTIARFYRIAGGTT